MTQYGLPWMGSKSRFAKWIMSHIPKEPILVDLFAGGCAVTDAALERGQRVVACDRCWQVLDLFDKTLYYGAPPLPDMPRTNQELRESDLLTQICWSFGTTLDTLAHTGLRATTRYRRICSIHTRHRAPGGWVRYYTGDSLSFNPPREPCVIYADPPYAGTASYDRGYADDIPIAEASTRQVVAQLREWDRPWLMSEASVPSGLMVVDQLPVTHGLHTHGAGRIEYLLTDPKWAQYFLQRLI